MTPRGLFDVCLSKRGRRKHLRRGVLDTRPGGSFRRAPAGDPTRRAPARGLPTSPTHEKRNKTTQELTLEPLSKDRAKMALEKKMAMWGRVPRGGQGGWGGLRGVGGGLWGFGGILWGGRNGRRPQEGAGSTNKQPNRSVLGGVGGKLGKFKGGSLSALGKLNL